MPKRHDHAPEFLHHLTPESMPGAPHDSWYCLEPPQRCATVPFALREDRTAAKAAPKLFLIQRQQRNQIGRIKPGSRAVCLFHGRSRLYVIRTDLLTDVTAKNMISHERTKITRNKAFELNRQIGNAASRIQHVGSHESSGGAGFQTEIALSTAIADRPIV